MMDGDVAREGEGGVLMHQPTIASSSSSSSVTSATTTAAATTTTRASLLPQRKGYKLTAGEVLDIFDVLKVRFFFFCLSLVVGWSIKNNPKSNSPMLQMMFFTIEWNEAHLISSFFSRTPTESGTILWESLCDLAFVQVGLEAVDGSLERFIQELSLSQVIDAYLVSQERSSSCRRSSIGDLVRSLARSLVSLRYCSSFFEDDVCSSLDGFSPLEMSRLRMEYSRSSEERTTFLDPLSQVCTRNEDDRRDETRRGQVVNHHHCRRSCRTIVVVSSKGR